MATLLQIRFEGSPLQAALLRHQVGTLGSCIEGPRICQLPSLHLCSFSSCSSKPSLPAFAIISQTAMALVGPEQHFAHMRHGLGTHRAV